MPSMDLPSVWSTGSRCRLMQGRGVSGCRTRTAKQVSWNRMRHSCMHLLCTSEVFLLILVPVTACLFAPWEDFSPYVTDLQILPLCSSFGLGSLDRCSCRFRLSCGSSGAASCCPCGQSICCIPGKAFPSRPCESSHALRRAPRS